VHKLLDIVWHNAVESLVEHRAWLAEDSRGRSTCPSWSITVDGRAANYLHAKHAASAVVSVVKQLDRSMSFADNTIDWPCCNDLH